MKAHPTIAALAAVLRARAVHAEIESNGWLCEDGVVAALITSDGRLRVTAVLDGVTDRVLRGFGDQTLRLPVDIRKVADEIERRIRERVEQAKRNSERTIEQAAE